MRSKNTVNLASITAKFNELKKLLDNVNNDDLALNKTKCEQYQNATVIDSNIYY